MDPKTFVSMATLRPSPRCVISCARPSRSGELQKQGKSSSPLDGDRVGVVLATKRQRTSVRANPAASEKAKRYGQLAVQPAPSRHVDPNKYQCDDTGTGQSEQEVLNFALSDDTRADFKQARKAFFLNPATALSHDS